MALWDDLLAEVYALTSRPELVAETAIGLRRAVRGAHASGRFWRDMVEVPVADVPTAQVQTIDLSLWAPNFRQVAYFGSASLTDLYFDPITIDDLIDTDGYARTNVFWGMGTELKLRPANVETAYRLAYFRYPQMLPVEVFSTWIADDFRDLLVTKAAAFVLGLVGEAEIKDKMDRISNELTRDLVIANLEIQAR